MNRSSEMSVLKLPAEISIIFIGTMIGFMKNGFSESLCILHTSL